ncbi:hypothetical protein E6C76_06955 [Pseudothauera nasutitermitis]|uniref:Uncharacterized protein n=1 Tax=Pseudothauera nasutitermitis TaxID=2565930 RepID=A0A4S4B293_9RHOO|nr:hypothetical protein E6C76_06955 [Pseudothauera nasutitermitis]
MTARGAGADSDLTIQGSQVGAGGDVLLAADDAIELLAARNTAELRSKNKSSSASIGFSIGTGGLAITAAASQGKGKASGDDLAWSNTLVQAGDTVQLSSGGDTTLAGARVEGERVIAEVGGNLHVESLQDVSTYDSKQKNSGFSISIPITGGVPSLAGIGGNISAGKSKVESDYASVTERSGIEAGDGGFQVTVGGDTTLIGGAIASTQQAVDDGKNHFQTGGELALVDLKNHAEYEAEAVSVNIGTGISTDGKLKPQGTSAGYGEDSGEAESVTTAGISGIAGDTDVRTGDAPTGIAPIFDADKVQKEIDAQVQITQVFGQLASKAIGDYAEARLKEATALRDQADRETDPARSAELHARADELEDQWGSQGTLRLAAHTVVGGLTGGIDGALGAAAGTLTAPAVADALNKAGIDADLNTVITAIASTAAGAAVGGTAGAGAALNEVANNYLKHSEILEKEARKKQECASGDSACRRQIEEEYSQRSQERDRAHESCDTAEACRAARLEIEQDMAELAARARELEQIYFEEKRNLTPEERYEALSISLNLTDALKSYDQTWRNSRDVIPFSEWTSEEHSKTFSDAVLALGGLKASGAVGKVTSGKTGAESSATSKGVSNLTKNGTLQNLRPGDAVFSQRPVRTLVQDDSGRYWLQSPSGNRITPSGAYDFVTMPNGTIRVSRPNSNPEFSTHLGLSGGADVSYAGSIRFSNNTGPNRGTIINWTNNSGHYEPPASLKNNAGLPVDLFNSH